MAKTLHARLVAYLPNGAKLGNLQAPLAFDASVIHNDLGALKVTYSRRAIGGGILKRGLEQGLEIGLEVSDGGAWTEPYNCRFLLIGRSRNAEDVSDTVTLTCQSMGWLANKILNNDTAHLITDGDNKGKRAFLSKNPGTILRTILDENKARKGAGLVLTPGFDTGKDAGNAAWKNVYTLYYSLGTSLNSMLSSMVGGGAIDWRTEGRTLRIWNADSTSLSRDLSGRVHVSMARDVLEAPEEESIEDLSSDILVEGDNGLIFRESNPAAPTPWGGWESYVSQGGVSDEATAKAFMQTTLASSARVRGQYTRSLLVTGAQSLPLVDYRPGDWISAPTVQHGEKVRIQQVTISLSSTGLKASGTLNDKVYDSQVRAAKKIQGITGGATLAGSEGGIPAPEKDHRTPKPPTGLVVQTDAYISTRGTALGLASLQWAAVSQATDNTAIDISGYRVEYRKNIAGAFWVSGGVTDDAVLKLGIGGLECGQKYEFRVRAVPTYSDRLGEWSTPVVALVASDVTPPSVPSKPILTSKYGIVDVEWDGKNNVNAGMEPDFDHCKVGISESNGNWQYRDSVARDGHCIVTGLTVYKTYWFALRSVDHSGNKSDWSAGASVAVQSAVSKEDLDQLDKDLADNKKAMEQAQKDITANRTEISAANKRIDANKTDIANANKELTQAKTDIEQANKELDAAQGDISQARKDITANQSAIANANKTLDAANKTLASHTASIESNRQSIQSAASKAQTALDKANSVGKSLDGLHNVFEGPDDPTTLSGVTVHQGDFWYKTQKCWTRWSGPENNSASLLADFYTYWLGPPNNSASVLVPLSSRVINVYVYDGSSWNERNLVAANILATGSVVAKNMAANSITSDKIVSAAIIADKLAANAVTAGKIAANAVNAAAIIAGAVTTEKLAALAVTADKLAAKAVIAGKIAANAVTAETIAAGAVVAGKLAANSVAAGNIVAGAVTADKLAANSVNAGKIAAGAVTADKLAANSVNASKIVSQSITGDKIASNTIVARNIAAQSITSDRIAAGQFTGYVFTGAVFQSSTADNTGWKLKGNALDMWDSKKNHTVHLDGEGEANYLTGRFQTGISGDRLVIDPDFATHTIGDPNRTQSGAGIQFPLQQSYYTAPYISSQSIDSTKGLISVLSFNGGMRTDGTAGYGTGFGAYGEMGQTRMGDASSKEQATVRFLAKCDYAHKSADTTRRDWYANSMLNTTSGSGTHAYLYAHKPNNTYAAVGARCRDPNDGSDGYVRAYLEATDPNGTVGVEANISTGYLYMGGFLGNYPGRGTFLKTHWRTWTGGSGTGRYPDVKYTFTPPKYGYYTWIACGDAGTDQCSVHTAYQQAGSVTVLGWGNAGIDVYTSLFGWLNKS